MRSATTLLLVALWAVVGTPTLCMGGWLGHPCTHAAPAAGGCHDHDEHTVAPVDAPADHCSHENSCLADPCAQVVKQDDDGSSAMAACADSHIPPCQEAPSAENLVSLSTEIRTQPFSAHHLKGRPYPDPAMPLLM